MATSRSAPAARALLLRLLLTAAAVTAQQEVVFHDGPGNVYSVEVISSGVLRAAPTFSADNTHVFTSIARDSATGVVNGTACFRTELGRIDWLSAPGCNAGMNPTVVDGATKSVYQACTVDPALPTAGGVFKLSQKTGEVVWRWPKEPVIGDNAARIHGFTADHLILTTGPYWAPMCGNGSIVVLNAADGSEAYTLPQPWAIATGVVEDGIAYLGMHCGDVVALTVATGVPLWSRSWSGRESEAIVATALVIEGDLIYVGMRGAMRAISKTNGDLVWSWYDPDGASVNAGPEVVRIPGRETEEPYVIFCTDAGRLITLQAQQQKTATIDAAGALIQTDAWTPLSMWTYQKDVQPDPTDAARFSMPVADTRSLTLFLGTWDGLVLQFDLLTGVLSPEVWYGAGQAAGVSIGTDRSYFIKGRKMYVNELPAARDTSGDVLRPEAAAQWDLDIVVALTGFQSDNSFASSKQLYVDTLLVALQESAGESYTLGLVEEVTKVGVANPPAIEPAPAMSLAPVTTQAPAAAPRRRTARRLLAGGNSNSEVRLGLKVWATDGGDLSRADAAALQSTIVDAAPGFMLRDIAALQADTPTSVSVASGGSPTVTARLSTPINGSSYPGVSNNSSVDAWVYVVAGLALAAALAALAGVLSLVWLRRRHAAQAEKLDGANALSTSEYLGRSPESKGYAPPSTGSASEVEFLTTASTEQRTPGASHMASAVPLPLPFFHDFHSNPASPEAQDQAQAQRALVTASPHLEEQMRTASEDAEGVSMGQGQLVADLAARSAGMPPPSHRLRRASVQICLMLDDRLENHNGVWADKWVLTRTRQMGPQSVIVGVEGAYGGTFLAKIYANKGLYQNELRLYQMPRMKGFFPDVVDMAGTAGSSTSVPCIEVPASGGAHTLPPHKIMLKGRSLEDQSTAQRHTLLEVMRVLGQVSLTLEILHAAGFAHLSLHAGNVIWMEETRTWAVTDLSSAHELGVSVSMSVLGARTRVSPPEVVALAESGSLTVTSRAASDAWALGCLGFELMSGSPLFPPGVPQPDLLAMLAGRAPFPWESDPLEWCNAHGLGALGDSLLQLLTRDPRQRIRVSCVRALWMHVLKDALAGR